MNNIQVSNNKAKYGGKYYTFITELLMGKRKFMQLDRWNIILSHLSFSNKFYLTVVRVLFL